MLQFDRKKCLLMLGEKGIDGSQPQYSIGIDFYEYFNFSTEEVVDRLVAVDAFNEALKKLKESGFSENQLGAGMRKLILQLLSQGLSVKDIVARVVEVINENIAAKQLSDNGSKSSRS